MMTAPGIITIDLDALAGNWRALARLVAPAECGAVVKADAYGLGAARVVPALWAAGCRTYFVATPDEATSVRSLVPQARLFVLDGLLQGSGEALREAGAMPVLSSLPEIAEWAAFGRQNGAPPACAIHIDSGLNRLGLSAPEVAAFGGEAGTLSGLRIALVMSHLACADDPSDPKNAAQLAAFNAARGKFPAIPASLAASDGLMLGQAYHFDLVRPGYALYGGQAFKGGATPVKPVLRVDARVLHVREVGTGETVGYSATWRAGRPSRIAVVAAGYADGFIRSGSNPGPNAGATVMYCAKSASVVGRISMDLITVDVTGIAPGPQRGDLVTLIGDGLSIETFGQHAGTIGYEVLTGLSRRFERRYIEECSS